MPLVPEIDEERAVPAMMMTKIWTAWLLASRGKLRVSESHCGFGNLRAVLLSQVLYKVLHSLFSGPLQGSAQPLRKQFCALFDNDQEEVTSQDGLQDDFAQDQDADLVPVTPNRGRGFATVRVALNVFYTDFAVFCNTYCADEAATTSQGS